MKLRLHLAKYLQNVQHFALAKCATFCICINSVQSHLIFYFRSNKTFVLNLAALLLTKLRRILQIRVLMETMEFTWTWAIWGAITTGLEHRLTWLLTRVRRTWPSSMTPCYRQQQVRYILRRTLNVIPIPMQDSIPSPSKYTSSGVDCVTLAPSPRRHQRSMYVGPPYCRAEMYAGGVACYPW